MKKNEGWFIKRLVILYVVMVLAASLPISAYTAEITTHFKDEISHNWINPISKAIVYDNGMNYEGLGASQYDSYLNFDPIIADDFILDAEAEVTDVHWIGGYWNGPPDDGNFDWEIIFYDDSGPCPGTAIATFTFTNAEVNETFISGTSGGTNWFSYSVDLPTPMSFQAGTKYWISIQGIGLLPPQSGWAFHESPMYFDQAKFKSVYFGYPDWVNTALVFGYPIDMCFQLTGPDWPNHKMHFPQLPDLIGWDVNATDPKTLADDWQCSESGLVKDIHFWGSWKNIDGDPTTDDVYTPMPFFQLSIHSNLPVGHPQNPFPWSMPGDLLWSWEGEILGTPSEPPTMEAWFNPNTGENICNDHVPYWRYDFFFDQAYPTPEPFYQLKDSIYWLDVSALYIQYPYQWGWKNSRDHFMDDAVYTDNPPFGPWYEMYEPPRCNWFDVYFDADGIPTDMGSTNYYGQGWYLYEWYYWWNMWFYDNPFTYEHQKHIWLEFYIEEVGAGANTEFAINWSTPEWDTLEMGRPPLPEDGYEALYIGREEFPVYPGWNTIDYTIPYNPEWVSIDFRAWDVVINGWVWHECIGTSLDLAFVITGEECTPHIDTEKKVWDESSQQWVDSIDMDVCNNVDFLITILNDGTCDLTNIKAEDFMDASLEFVDAAPYPDIINPVPGGTYLEWNFPGPMLPGNSMDISVTAHVVGPACHLDSNYVFVHAAYEPQAIEVYDEDAAYVHATEPPWPNHKMHYPQLPDPEGWDILATKGYADHPGIVAADDFMCMKSGPITEIHFWGSWLVDVVAPIQGFWLSIHENIPGPPYSMPGAELWTRYVTQYEMVSEGQGLQGWYDPFMGWWEHPDHVNYYRYDITNIPEPFYQDSGTIYWLNVMADIGPPGYQGFPEPPLWGWKTSRSPHFLDDATWAVWTWPVFEWYPLEDPRTGMTLDLAFVVGTEEIPVTCGDVNNDGIINVGDVVYMVSYLYRGGPAPVPMTCVGDVNNDDIVNVGDIVFLVSYLYRGGPAPNPLCCTPPWAAE